MGVFVLAVLVVVNAGAYVLAFAGYLAFVLVRRRRATNRLGPGGEGFVADSTVRGLEEATRDFARALDRLPHDSREELDALGVRAARAASLVQHVETRSAQGYRWAFAELQDIERRLTAPEPTVGPYR